MRIAMSCSGVIAGLRVEGMVNPRRAVVCAVRRAVVCAVAAGALSTARRKPGCLETRADVAAKRADCVSAPVERTIVVAKKFIAILRSLFEGG